MYQISEIKITPSVTIREAFRIIDTGAMKIALVVDEAGRLIGTLTDGDIRRGLLKGMEMDDPIRDIYNHHPISVKLSDPKEKIIELAVARRIYQIPVVDDDGRVIRLAEIDHLIKQEKHPNTIVLMAGGLGSRLRPLTNHTPKPMLPVGGRPILETVIRQFQKQGFSKFIVALNYKGDMVRNYFGDGATMGVDITYLEEKQRMGTAGALGLLQRAPNESFFVMNADILTLVNFENLLEFHIRNGADATMCIREYGMEVPYGVVRLNKNNIVSIEEKPIQQFYVNAGIYVLTPETLNLIPKGLPMDMTGLFEMAVDKGMITLSFPIREFWMDIGKPEDYERANLDYYRLFNE
ncbi:MAG: nucleotidyltransferase family protein [Bacteroidales bacterium]|jgi:dTDP-glucose pyrophosphorylase